jgi:hypothetical protein
MLNVYVQCVDDVLSWHEYPQRRHLCAELREVVREVAANIRPLEYSDAQQHLAAELQSLCAQILDRHRKLLADH